MHRLATVVVALSLLAASSAAARPPGPPRGRVVRVERTWPDPGFVMALGATGALVGLTVSAIGMHAGADGRHTMTMAAPVDGLTMHTSTWVMVAALSGLVIGGLAGSALGVMVSPTEEVAVVRR